MEKGKILPQLSTETLIWGIYSWIPNDTNPRCAVSYWVAPVRQWKCPHEVQHRAACPAVRKFGFQRGGTRSYHRILEAHRRLLGACIRSALLLPYLVPQKRKSSAASPQTASSAALRPAAWRQRVARENYIYRRPSRAVIVSSVGRDLCFRQRGRRDGAPPKMADNLPSEFDVVVIGTGTRRRWVRAGLWVLGP